MARHARIQPHRQQPPAGPSAHSPVQFLVPRPAGPHNHRQPRRPQATSLFSRLFQACMPRNYLPQTATRSARHTHRPQKEARCTPAAPRALKGQVANATRDWLRIYYLYRLPPLPSAPLRRHWQHRPEGDLLREPACACAQSTKHSLSPRAIQGLAGPTALTPKDLMASSNRASISR